MRFHAKEGLASLTFKTAMSFSQQKASTSLWWICAVTSSVSIRMQSPTSSGELQKNMFFIECNVSTSFTNKQLLYYCKAIQLGIQLIDITSETIWVLVKYRDFAQNTFRWNKSYDFTIFEFVIFENSSLNWIPLISLNLTSEGHAHIQSLQ